MECQDINIITDTSYSHVGAIVANPITVKFLGGGGEVNKGGVKILEDNQCAHGEDMQNSKQTAQSST